MRWLTLSILAGVLSTAAFVVVAVVGSDAAITALGTVIGAASLIDLGASIALKRRLHHQ